MNQKQSTNYKVVFLNQNGKVMDTRYLDADSFAELDSKANAIAKKLLDYSSVITWEASVIIRRGSTKKNEHIEEEIQEEENEEKISLDNIYVLVDIVPMTSGNRYYATVWNDKKDLFKLVDTSMKELLLQLKTKASELSWQKDKVNIQGEFYYFHLTKDDEIAWETPIWDL